MQYVVKVYVSLKKSVADPQGVVVKQSLSALGYSQIDDVRVGKYFEISLQHDGADKELGILVKAMCEKLLINPVIEDYEFEWTKIDN